MSLRRTGFLKASFNNQGDVQQAHSFSPIPEELEGLLRDVGFTLEEFIACPAAKRDKDYYSPALLSEEGELPESVVSVIVANEDKEETTLKSYLLEVFDPTLPRYRMKKRLSDYVKYLDDEDITWKEQTNTEKLPIVLFVCPRTTDLIYAKRRTRKLIADSWEWKDEDEKRPRIRFTTADKLKQHSLLSKIWEEA